MHEEVIDGVLCKVAGNRQGQGTENNPRRIRDLPPEEQELFKAFLHLRCCPLLPGVPQVEQDGYWPADYREWQAGRKSRDEEYKEHMLKNGWRLRDLPQEEQGPFWEWMLGQTRPYVPGLPQEEQDFIYQHDYDRWKAGLDSLD